MSISIGNSNYPLYPPHSPASAANTATPGSTKAAETLLADSDSDKVTLSETAAESSAPAGEAPSAGAETAGAAACKTSSEYMKYLKEKYSCLSKGNVTVSTKFLNKCLQDPSAAADFELYLKKIPDAEKTVAGNAKAGNASVLKINWAFDDEGKISSVTVLQSHAAGNSMETALLDSLGDKQNAAKGMLELLQAQLGVTSGITVNYSDSNPVPAVAGKTSAAVDMLI